MPVAHFDRSNFNSAMIQLKGTLLSNKVYKCFIHGNGLRIKFKTSTYNPEVHITYFLSVVCFNAPPLKLQRQHS